MKESPLAFDCNRCGHCCQGEGGIVLTGKDQARLAEHLGRTVQEFLKQYTLNAGAKIQLSCREDGFCVFFAEGCSVHPARPDICRAWPFFRGNLVDADSWAMAQDYCPGINPKASFRAFVTQGLAYLHQNGLGHDGDEDAPCALRLTGVKPPEPLDS